MKQGKPFDSLRKRLRGARCKDCIFYRSLEDEEGRCQMLPPRGSGFPRVLESQWCGQFIPREHPDAGATVDDEELIG